MVGTDHIAGLREVFRELFMFGGWGMQQCACRAVKKSAPLKGAYAERPEYYVPAAATCRLRSRTNKTEIPTTASFS